MMNPKNICISACVGFCLSFLIGIVSGVGFLYVLLRAVIFAVVFGALYVGIAILYQKFLLNDSPAGFSSDSEQASPKAQAGGIVNLVVDDSVLPDEESAPSFSVRSGRTGVAEGTPAVQVESRPNETTVETGQVVQKQELNNDASEQPPRESAHSGAIDDASVGNSSFQPVPLGAMTKVAPEEKASAAESSVQPEKVELDELPDIGDFTLGDQSGVSHERFEETDDNGSDFASSGSGSSFVSGEQNTDVMAQAIRTILAKDT